MQQTALALVLKGETHREDETISVDPASIKSRSDAKSVFFALLEMKNSANIGFFALNMCVER